MKKRPLIILSAPSGAGKSTFCTKVVNDYEGKVVDVITYTTRPMRPGENEGDPYHFVSKQKYDELKSENFFVESAKVHSNYYGTPAHVFEDCWDSGKLLIMDLDVQGAQTFRGIYPDATYIFIEPPSIDELRNRLLLRDGKTKDLELRLENAQREMGEKPKFDYCIVNDDFDKAYNELQKIIANLLNSQ